jgi:ribosomal protein S18 acetylase RimI-like enzyme
LWDCASLRLDDFDRETAGELVLVAHNQHRAIGFISVWTPDNFIHHLHVDPAFQRQGVGSELLGALPGWPATRFRLKCLAENEPALAFYAANGFTQIGERGSGPDRFLLLEGAGR